GDTCSEQVLVDVGLGVEAVTDGEVTHLVDDDAALEAGVDRDLLERRLDRELHDRSTGRLVALEVERLERRLAGLDESHATTGDDALFDGRLRVAHGVLDAVLALLELDLGRRARLDDGHAARELGKALLELLAVVVRVRVLDLGADLVDPALDLRLVAATLDDRRLVLRHDDLAGRAEDLEADRVELEADRLGDDRATREDRDVLQDRLAAVTEAGRLDGDRLEDAADLVDHERRESLALDVLGDHEQRLARLDDLLEQGQQVLDVRDLRLDEQDVGVLEHSLLALGVGHEVRREVALVEAHTLGELELEAERVRLLDRDDAFLADLVHRLGDELTDREVTGRD